MPRVSIIMPAYNSDQFIEDAIRSVFDQTFTDFELIVINDGSTDRTEEIVKIWQEKHPTRLRYIIQQNGGPAKARNRGLSESQGEYIAFLDADDLWLPNRLAETVKALDEHSEWGLVHGRSIRIDEFGNVLEKAKRDLRYLSGYIFPYLLTRKAHITCLTVMLRKVCLEEVGLFDESQECFAAEDRDLWLRISKKCKMGFIDLELGYYRIRENSISRDPEKIILRKIYVINKNCTNIHDYRLKNRALSMVYRESADDFLSRKKCKEARECYIKAIKIWPFSFWNWRNVIKTI